jgi:hypothetical protein
MASFRWRFAGSTVAECRERRVSRSRAAAGVERPDRIEAATGDSAMHEAHGRRPSVPSVSVEPRPFVPGPASCRAFGDACRNEAWRQDAARHLTASLVAGVVRGPLADPVAGAAEGRRPW